MKEMDRMDQLIEKVVIEGAEFQIIQKPATLYAGYRAETDNGDEESNVDTSQLFQAGYKNIKNSLRRYLKLRNYTENGGFEPPRQLPDLTI